jgi:hypothetical protein
MARSLPPDAGCFIEFQKHHLPSCRTTAANELHAESPSGQPAAATGMRAYLPLMRQVENLPHLELHVGPRWLAAVTKGTQK